MRVAVTGASGNLGTALLRRLNAEGHQAVGISRRRPPETAPFVGVPWHQIDLGARSAPAALTDAIRGADAVVHLAWLIQPSRDREVMRRANQDGSRAVLSAVRASGVPHLVHMSSVGAYSPAEQGMCVDESWPCDGVPTSYYSVDKAAVEHLLDTVSTAEFTLSRVRPTLVLQAGAASEIARYFLGPLLPVGLLGPAAMRLAPWPRALKVQFVHSDDVADAVLRVLLDRIPGAFNVAAEPVVDRGALREAFGGVGPPIPPPLLRLAVQISWRLHLQPTNAGWVDMAMLSPLMDTTRIRALGWRPQHSGIDALRELVTAMKRGQGGRGPLLFPRRESLAHLGRSTSAL
jgi:nucleoside-diphosphate-sugar epimerase